MYSDILFDYLSKTKKTKRKNSKNLKSVNIESEQDLAIPSIRDSISKDYYEINSDLDEKTYGKPKGKYELITIPEVIGFGKNEINICIEEVTKVVKKFLGKIKNSDKILVVGLGNRHISSDSLGSKVVGKINVTIENVNLPKVMAICPSVMGLTGIETVDIVEGVISKTKPTHVLIIDSLCAGAVERLGRSIQITNTGICPGGGIGNKRKCIGKNIAKNVISIGIPLLIYSSTFVSDTMQKFGIDEDTLQSTMQIEKKWAKSSQILDILENMKKVLKDESFDMIVSIKDIEECVEVLSTILAGAINKALGVYEN